MDIWRIGLDMGGLTIFHRPVQCGPCLIYGQWRTFSWRTVAIVTLLAALDVWVWTVVFILAPEGTPLW